MSVFPTGELNKQIQHFQGINHMALLATNEEYPHGIANVTFAAGAKTDWHAHHYPQVLLITEGAGWLQIKGEEPTRCLPGDTFVIPADVWHWHGAAKDTSFIHLAIGADPEPGATAWGKQVTFTE